MKKALYMVIEKDGEKTIKWAVSDSIEQFIPMCKYLLKNIIGSKDFTVVWTNGTKTTGWWPANDVFNMQMEIDYNKELPDL